MNQANRFDTRQIMWDQPNILVSLDLLVTPPGYIGHVRISRTSQYLGSTTSRIYVAVSAVMNDNGSASGPDFIPLLISDQHFGVRFVNTTAGVDETFDANDLGFDQTEPYSWSLGTAAGNRLRTMMADIGTNAGTVVTITGADMEVATPAPQPPALSNDWPPGSPQSGWRTTHPGIEAAIPYGSANG